jgi:hypothetical protein
MRNRTLALALAVFATSVLHASPIVTRLAPSQGSGAGGQLVTIDGKELLPDVVCVLPCPTVVTFGGIEVPLKGENDARLVVLTPPHAAGSVDVTVSVAGETVVTIPNAFTFTSAVETDFESVLVPVYAAVPLNGAANTRWKTDFWLRNEGPDPVTIAPWSCGTSTCFLESSSMLWMKPSTTVHDSLASSGENPSRIVYLGKDQASSVALSMRLVDLNQAEVYAGTEIPLVRERSLRTTTLQLLNVPFHPAFRLLLRVYDTALPNASFRVNVYPADHDGAPALASFDLTARTEQSGVFRNVAAYAQADLRASLAGLPLPESARIEIVPLQTGSRFWSFVSITNDTTQFVTLVTPQ